MKLLQSSGFAKFRTKKEALAFIERKIQEDYRVTIFCYNEYYLVEFKPNEKAKV
jgi:hypothetical protein